MRAPNTGNLRKCHFLEDLAPKERRESMRRGTGFRRLGAAQEKDRKFEGRFCSGRQIGKCWDGFDAQETSCELNTIKRQGAAWLASFSCSGAGLTWLEDDEIRVGKDGWTLEVRRVGDPIRYCVANKC